jgi:hypothetical protein
MRVDIWLLGGLRVARIVTVRRLAGIPGPEPGPGRPHHERVVRT